MLNPKNPNGRKAKKVLYISYDGMTDQLGQSQVIPYLQQLCGFGYEFTLLSCEKPHRLAKNRSLIEDLLADYPIDWQPMPFTSSPPVLAKLWDLRQMKQKASTLHRQKQFDLCHCRSYVGSFVGAHLKKKFGVKMLFDMRGFWVDERVEGKIWNIKNPFFKWAYSYYKKQEAMLIRQSDAIVSLTEKGKTILQNWTAYNHCPVSVIPCCADLDLFQVSSKTDRQAARKALGLGAHNLVVSYLGALGTWYMLDEMLDCWKVVKAHYPDAQFLFVTTTPKAVILDRAAAKGIAAADFVITPAPRQKVPQYIGASDLMLFFILPVFSKQASSPVKLGEALAVGLPVITNGGVGDVENIVRDTQSGLTVSDFSPAAYQQIVAQIPELLKKDADVIRKNAAPYYSLSNGAKKYAALYERIFQA